MSQPRIRLTPTQRAENKARQEQFNRYLDEQAEKALAAQEMGQTGRWIRESPCDAEYDGNQPGCESDDRCTWRSATNTCADGRNEFPPQWVTTEDYVQLRSNSNEWDGRWQTVPDSYLKTHNLPLNTAGRGALAASKPKPNPAQVRQVADIILANEQRFRQGAGAGARGGRSASQARRSRSGSPAAMPALGGQF